MRNPEDIQIGEHTLAEILELHLHWLNEDGTAHYRIRADLSGADLSDAYLMGACLYGADLSGACLYDAFLCAADLRKTDLRGACLCKADLSEALLDGADLREADLSGAYIRRAINIPPLPMACPDTGSFVGWKYINTTKGKAIAKLQIPDGIPRSSGTNRMCRAERVRVLEIQDMDGNRLDVSGTSPNAYNVLTYRVGDMVIADSWDEYRWNECSNGIHFFINRQEAVEYADGWVRRRI